MNILPIFAPDNTNKLNKQTSHMETKHTKGNWYVSDIKQPDGEYIYTELYPFSAIARVYKGDNPHVNEAEANARLIASAPQLLEALKFAERIISSKESGIPSDDLVLIRYTIQTATNNERK